MLIDHSNYFFAAPRPTAPALPVFHLGHTQGSRVVMNYPDAEEAWEWADVSRSIAAATLEAARAHYRTLFPELA